MKKLTASMLALMIIAAPMAAQAKAAKLIGKWKVVKVKRNDKEKPFPKHLEMIVEFKKGGGFITSLTHNGKTRSKSGTWKISDGKLITSIGGRTDKVDFAVSAKKLRLTKSEDGKTETLFLKRQ